MADRAKAKEKAKSRVNEAGNYTKQELTYNQQANTGVNLW